MTPTMLLRGPRVALQSFGVTGIRLRAQHEMRRRLGLYLASPRVQHVEHDSAQSSSTFDVDLDRVRATVDRAAAIERANRVADGWHQAYRHEWRRRPMSSDDWSVHPELGTRYPAEPWWELRRFLSLNPAYGDVKDVWEPARFTWVFDLALGYAVSRDDRYAEAFWAAVESFIDGNPPFRGIQWGCGQETSIRALSCLWGERVFASAAASTAARRVRIQDLFAWSGERVANAIEYAISQRNNHGISEATGLIALGYRLGGRHPDANTWLRDGARWLEYLVMDQFAEDGWYIQHSLNYLRMALDQLVVAERVLLRARGTGLSSPARARVRAAVALLLELHDAEQGDVPNHGANDGSMVFPVTTRPYRDFRPSITAAAATFGVSVPEHFGVSLDALAWLGIDALTTHADPPARRVVSGSSGWVAARNGVVRVFARAGSYESNPSHIDPCHVDVWIEDQARAVDAGTYRYTAPPPWRNGLALIGVHNTVDIPSIPAAVKGRRFLWLGRPAARVSRADVTNDVVTFELHNQTWSEHGITHLRRCVLSDHSVDIFDEFDVGENRSIDVRVHWLMPEGTDLPSITSDGHGRMTIKHADTDSVNGWWSPHYGERLPAVSIAFVTRVTGRRIVHSRFLATNLPNEPFEFSQERRGSA